MSLDLRKLRPSWTWLATAWAVIAGGALLAAQVQGPPEDDHPLMTAVIILIAGVPWLAILSFRFLRECWRGEPH